MNVTPVLRLLLSKYARVEGTQNLFKISKLNRCCSFSTSMRRCETAPDGSEYPPNSSIVPNLVNNRNPRNLEKLRIGDKPLGYSLEKESRTYWNKVTLDISRKHITASVVHHLGLKPITVSTKEWCLKKYLYSTNDASASKLVGQVLAQRCLQMGIIELACFFPEEERSKEKVKLFLDAIQDGGVTLGEPSLVRPDWNIHHYEPVEEPWEVHEDIDDKFTVATKLRPRVIRKQQNPHATTEFELARKKYAALTTKTDSVDLDTKK